MSSSVARGAINERKGTYRDGEEPVIEIRGGLFELPPDIGEALNDPRLSECLLFHLQRYFDDFYGYMSFERWERKYRIVQDKKLKKEKELHSDHHLINNRLVLFVTGASYLTTRHEEEIIDTDDAETSLIEEVVKITFPLTHLVILDMHMPPEVIQHLNLDSIATLALPAKSLGPFRNPLLAVAPAASRSRLHLLIFRIDKEDQKKFVEALVHMCLSLHLEVLSWAPPFTMILLLQLCGVKSWASCRAKAANSHTWGCRLKHLESSHQALACCLSLSNLG